MRLHDRGFVIWMRSLTLCPRTEVVNLPQEPIEIVPIFWGGRWGQIYCDASLCSRCSTCDGGDNFSGAAAQFATQFPDHLKACEPGVDRGEEETRETGRHGSNHGTQADQFHQAVRATFNTRSSAMVRSLSLSELLDALSQAAVLSA